MYMAAQVAAAAMLLMRRRRPYTVALAIAVLIIVGDALFDVGGGRYTPVVWLGIASGVTQAALSVVWLRSFQYGPMEWVWRCLTWWGWVRIRRDRPASRDGR